MLLKHSQCFILHEHHHEYSVYLPALFLFPYQSSPAPLLFCIHDSVPFFSSFRNLNFASRSLPLSSSFNCKALSSYKSLMIMSHRTLSIFMYSCCHWRLETERIGSFWQSITALMDTQECVTSNRHAEGERLRGGGDRGERTRQNRREKEIWHSEVLRKCYSVSCSRINLSYAVPKAISHIHTVQSCMALCSVSNLADTPLALLEMLTHPFPWQPCKHLPRN